MQSTDHNHHQEAWVAWVDVPGSTWLNVSLCVHVPILLRRIILQDPRLKDAQLSLQANSPSSFAVHYYDREELYQAYGLVHAHLNENNTDCKLPLSDILA